jgi:O-methyltransferase
MTELTQSPAVTQHDLGDEVVCPRNPLVQALKPILASSRSVLPEALYAPMYDFLFAAYKGTLRAAYARKIISSSISGDRAALFRARAIHRVMPYSLVGASGLEATFDAAFDLVANEISGAFVECGVARGGCAALMATVGATEQPPRKMWLFDSFEGLPSPTDEDYSDTEASTGKHIRPLVRGSCLGTKPEVECLLFSKFDFQRDSISLVQGWFQDTLPAFKNKIGPIALLRIDGDWYESTKCCLENLYDSVTPGGTVIIDDYGVCFGCKKAVHEFLRQRNLRPRLIPDRRGGVRFSKAA